MAQRREREDKPEKTTQNDDEIEEDYLNHSDLYEETSSKKLLGRQIERNSQYLDSEGVGVKSKSERTREAKYDMGYLIQYTCVIGFSSMQFGFCSTGIGPVISSLRYQLNWDPAIIEFNSTILTTAAIVGISLGCIFGGDFVKYGRRATLIRFNIVGLLGSILCMFLNFWQMCFGRFVLGISAGVIISTTPKMLDESIPSHLMDKGFGMTTSLFINLAFMGCLLLGGGSPDDPEVLKTSKFWMVLFGVQIPFQILNIALNQFIFREETVDFSIKIGDKPQALRQIANVYPTETPEMHEMIYEQKYDAHIDKMNQMGDKPDTLWHALTDPNQRTSSWICIIIAIFNSFSGIGLVQVFCSDIFFKIQQLGGRSMFTTVQQTYWIGATPFIGSLLSYYSVMYFSRRSLFVGGHFLMAIVYFIGGYFIKIRQADLVLLSLVVFILVFQVTQGSGFWLYVSEVIQSDSVIGVCLFANMMCLTVQSMTTQTLLNSGLGVTGLFNLLGFIQIFAFVILAAIIKETKHLTSQEKKEVYSPAKELLPGGTIKAKLN